ncbi:MULTISPECIES: hypothetical protein [unclassified Streptomyces]|uniref:hypothetical protein n=1 Tax=unclassified Streptomyces TaxID=2593676 RepID=UPI000365CBD3|nr:MULTISPECIES: hypothetical protein [unclassified Streptomyces]MYT28657.1 hypothetical protein [Streptomyces sp. SID8354]
MRASTVTIRPGDGGQGTRAAGRAAPADVGSGVERLATAVRKTGQRHEVLGAAVELADNEPRLVLGRHHSGPPLRTTLFRPPDGGPSLLLFAWHHPIMHGWSLRTVLDDLGRFSADPSVAADPLPVTVCDLNARRYQADTDAATDQAVTRVAEALRGPVEAAPAAEPTAWTARGELRATEAPTTPQRAKFGIARSLLRGPGRLTGRPEHRTSVLAPDAPPAS